MLEAAVSNDIKKPSSSETSCEAMLKPYVCGERHSSNSTLKERVDIHLKEKQFKCDVCLKEFGRNFHLKRHKMIHALKRLFVCELCGSWFSRKDNLQVHLKGYSCTTCAKTFCRKYDLRIHCRDEHDSSPTVSSLNPYTDQVKHHKRVNLFSTTVFDCCEEFALDVSGFLNSLRSSIQSELKYMLYEKKCVKWSLMMEVLVKPSFENGISESFTLSLDSNTISLFSESSINECIDFAYDEIMLEFEQYVLLEISLTFIKILKLYVSTAKI